MFRHVVFYAFVAAPAAARYATEHAEERMGCTAIAFDGAATTDGSAFAGMNADSGSADYRLTYVPARDHPKGAKRAVFTFDLAYPRWIGYGRGEFFHPFKGHEQLSEPVGHIPEVASTYGYYESTEPLMNDQGLVLGESSCAAMLVNRFPGDKNDTRDVPVGMLDTVTLMQLAVERCATARCAVKLMGELSEKHGFVPTPGEPTTGRVRGRSAWDDAGEAYTLADRTGEAWVFHVLGGVTNVTKSVWAGVRVPKGHFALVPNDFVIAELPSEPNDDYLFNTDLFRAAKVAGLWDGQGALHFSKTFAPEPAAFESPTGFTPIPLYGSLRRWALLNLAAPSLGLSVHLNSHDYPFSVKVEKPLNHRDIFKYLRYQYEDTEFDMTKGMLAGPFGNPFRLEGGPRDGQVARGIAISRTLYSIIGQTGPKRQVGWFALDTPTTSVYVPLNSRVGAVSSEYSVGHQAEFSKKSAGWAFNFVSNYMQLNYQAMSAQDVYPMIESWQDRIDKECEHMEHAHDKDLAHWQAKLQEQVVASWWNMSEFLIMKYNDGRINYPVVGRSTGYPQWFADMVGFNNDVHPLWASPAHSPAIPVDGYIAPVFSFPIIWDGNTSTWSFAPIAVEGLSAVAVAASTGPALAAVFSSAVALLVGIALGRNMERRKVRLAGSAASFEPLL